MYEELVKQFGARARRDEPMSRHTTFRIGGPADLLVDVETPDELRHVLSYAVDQGVGIHVIGRGANVLVSDSGIRGVVLRLAGDFRRIVFDEDKGTANAGSGATLSTLLADSTKGGWSSFAWAVGIPGTLGGAVACNAGAWGRAIGEFVEALHVMTREGEERVLLKEEVTFDCRRSSLTPSEIITEVSLRLERAAGDEQDLRDLTAGYLARKRKTQPLDLPSAGSVFKNTPHGPAGQLIDRAGCKGMREGDAVVSPKHANFIVNEGKATAADVLRLIERVSERMKAESGVDLELEIRLL